MEEAEWRKQRGAGDGRKEEGRVGGGVILEGERK